jgi:hypothetical protein
MGMSMDMKAVERRIRSCGPADDVIGCNGVTILPSRKWTLRRITTTVLPATKSRVEKAELLILCLIS